MRSLLLTLAISLLVSPAALAQVGSPDLSGPRSAEAPLSGASPAPVASPPPGFSAGPGPPPNGYGAPAPYAPPPGAPPPGYPPPPPYYPFRYAPPPPPEHTHDGTYVRLQLGGGFIKMSSSQGGLDVEVSGSGPSFVLGVGGAVSRNLIVYGAIMDTQASQPEIKSGGTTLATGTGESSAGVVGIGPGMAYYFDASNLFLSGTILLSKLVINDSVGDKVGESDWGLTAEAQFGKEWWVSDNWGLGLSLQGLLGSMKDKDRDNSGNIPTWHSRALSLLFSATYN